MEYKAEYTGALLGCPVFLPRRGRKDSGTEVQASSGAVVPTGERSAPGWPLRQTGPGTAHIRPLVRRREESCHGDMETATLRPHLGASSRYRPAAICSVSLRRGPPAHGKGFWRALGCALPVDPPGPTAKLTYARVSCRTLNSHHPARLCSTNTRNATSLDARPSPARVPERTWRIPARLRSLFSPASCAGCSAPWHRRASVFRCGFRQ